MSLKSDIFRVAHEHAKKMAEAAQKIANGEDIKPVAPINFRDILRMLGKGGAIYQNNARHRFEREFAEGGDLFELVKFADGQPPMIYAEKLDKFAKVKPTDWELRLTGAGFAVATTEPEPPAVQDQSLLVQLRLLGNVKLPPELAEQFLAAAAIVAEDVEISRATQVLATWLSVGELASKVPLQEGNIEDLRQNRHTMTQRVEDLQKRLLMGPTRAPGRRAGMQEEPVQAPVQPSTTTH